jgi:predicted DNA-binding transcriptional regulator AlpA
MAKKSRRARRKLGDQRPDKSSPTSAPLRISPVRPLGRWARNGELARYLNVSKMTIWRWKHQPHYNFPVAVKIDSMEFNDLDKVDAWMRAHVSEQGGGR